MGYRDAVAYRAVYGEVGGIAGDGTTRIRSYHR